MDIIADDLSGAADTGLQFLPVCKQGVPIILNFEDSVSSEAVVVYNTDSRNMSETDACESIRDLCKWLRKGAVEPPRRIFKKIDSTLRGHLRAELLALMDGLVTRICCVAPAFPEAGP